MLRVPAEAEPAGVFLLGAMVIDLGVGVGCVSDGVEVSCVLVGGRVWSGGGERLDGILPSGDAQVPSIVVGARSGEWSRSFSAVADDGVRRGAMFMRRVVPRPDGTSGLV